MKNILYIMSSYNIYGGTPKKTLDLMRHFNENSHIYVYYNRHPEFKFEYEKTGGGCHEGFFGRNIFKHVRKLLKIIDDNNIEIIQTQFSMGEGLGFLLKILRPNIKLIIAFVGPFQPSSIKKILSHLFYTKTDGVIYVSEYVKREKINQFRILKKKKSKIIYNGTEERKNYGDISFSMELVSILGIAALIEWKNIQILISAMDLIISKYHRTEIHLYIAGDGIYRQDLEMMIASKGLENNIHLLGNQKKVGNLLKNCTVFVHPSYAEGFGIAVAEAMMAGKPIIVSNAGALPELIEDKKTGIILNPSDFSSWSNWILNLIDDPKYAKKLGDNAKRVAKEKFTVEKFALNYVEFYETL